MGKATLYNYSTATTDILTENYASLGAGINILGEIKRGFLGGSNFIMSTANSTTASLTETVDYVLLNEDTYYTSKIGETVYTGVQMMTHGSTDLWITYKCVGSYTDVTPVSNIKTLSKNIVGLTLSNSAGDANNDIDIAAGVCMDSTYNYFLTLSSVLTKQLDAAWSVGTNAGGLDTGAKAASTTYHIYIIRKDTDGTIDALFSLNESSPTMPTGYSIKRVIGCIITDGASNIYAFYQIGNKIRLKTQIDDRAYTALANTNRILANVSSPKNLFGIFNVLIHVTTASTGILIAQYSGETDSAPGETNNTHKVFETWDYTPLEMELLVDNNRQIAIRGNSTVVYCRIGCCGWIDHRIL